MPGGWAVAHAVAAEGVVEVPVEAAAAVRPAVDEGRAHSNPGGRRLRT